MIVSLVVTTDRETLFPKHQLNPEGKMSGVVIKLNEDEEDDEEEADVAGLLARHRRQVGLSTCTT